MKKAFHKRRSRTFQQKNKTYMPEADLQYLTENDNVPQNKVLKLHKETKEDISVQVQLHICTPPIIFLTDTKKRNQR